MFVLAGDGSWDERTRLISRNGTALADQFGNAVSLSGDRALIGARLSDEKGDESGAYIFHMMNGVWQEEAKLVTTDGAGVYIFGYDVAIFGDTAIIRSPYDADMASYSDSVYFFIRRDDGTWEEEQRLAPADSGYYFGWRLAISGDTSAIGAKRPDDERGRYGGSGGSGYVYTKIDGERTGNITIVPENGAASAYFESSVAILGSTALLVPYQVPL